MAGPPPSSSAISRARCTAAYTAKGSLPSTRMAGIPKARPRGATPSPLYCSATCGAVRSATPLSRSYTPQPQLRLL
eukprot:scaffold59797_cov36-Phaeocystis_antarctica.AAC.1